METINNMNDENKSVVPQVPKGIINLDGLNLPSYFQVGETCDLGFQNSKNLLGIKIAAVKFTDYGKVLYDVEVPVGFESETTVLHDVDSAFFTKQQS